MFSSRSLIVWWTAVLLCAMTAPTFAQNDMETLRAELEAIKAELAELRNAQGDNWLNERRAEEIKGLIRDVLADAETRMALTEDGFYAGVKDGKFFLSSADGNYTMYIGGQIQFRYLVNVEGDTASKGHSDNEDHGFQLRRAKLKLKGNVIVPELKYILNFASERDEVRDSAGDTVGGSSSNVFVEDAIIAYETPFFDGLTVYFGKMKIPFLRQELISSSKQLAIERANVTEFFTQDRSLGLTAAWKNDWLQLIGGVFQGADLEVTDFNNSSNAKVNLTGRVNVKVAGDWKQATDMAAWSGKDEALFMGGAFSYQSNRNTAGSDDEEYHGFTVDALYKNSGFSMLAAFMGANLETADRDPLGALLEAGYFVVPDTLQPYLRYEWLDDDAGSKNIHILTAGANYFFKKHNAKFSADVVYVLNGDTVSGISPFGNSAFSDGTGFNGFTGEHQIVFRTQLQLLF